MVVIISNHAMQRWQERVGPAKHKDVLRLVSNNLKNQLKLGLKAHDKESFALEVKPTSVTAVLSIDPRGYWVVKTFHLNSWAITKSDKIREGADETAWI